MVDFLSVAVVKESLINLLKRDDFPTPYSPHNIIFCSGYFTVAWITQNVKGKFKNLFTYIPYFGQDKGIFVVSSVKCNCYVWVAAVSCPV